MFATAAAVAVTTLGTAGVVSAADCEFSTAAVGSTDCSADVSPTPLDPSVDPSAPAVASTGSAAAGLPVTGTESATLGLAGLAMVGGGTVLVKRSRVAETH